MRIIGGQWRRQLLPVLAHEGLRPSSDRVRETLFNWLSHFWGGQFTDKVIVDAFAGSGALGLECVSRGARQVTLLDAYAPAITQIQKTLQHWRQQDASVSAVQALCVDAVPFLSRCADKQTWQGGVDCILLDPPFAQGWLEKILPLLPKLSHADTLLYVEAEPTWDADILTEHGWRCLREGQTRQVKYGLWAWSANGTPTV